MRLIDAFDTAFFGFDVLVPDIGEDQWDAPTPCAEWTVRDLLNHMTSEHLWAPPLLAGATLAQVGDRFDGDVLGEDPVRAWEKAGAASRSAFHGPGALEGRVHVTGGETSAESYGWQMTTDLAVHGWDLARGTGSAHRMDEDLAHALYTRIEPSARAGRGSGAFAPPVDVAGDASWPDRLVALLGREP